MNWVLCLRQHGNNMTGTLPHTSVSMWVTLGVSSTKNLCMEFMTGGNTDSYRLKDSEPTQRAKNRVETVLWLWSQKAGLQCCIPWEATHKMPTGKSSWTIPSPELCIGVDNTSWQSPKLCQGVC